MKIEVKCLQSFTGLRSNDFADDISQRKFRVQRFSDSICKASFPSFSEDFEDLQLQTSAPNRYFPLSGLKIDICLYLLQN